MHRFVEEGKVRFIGQRGPHRYARDRKIGVPPDEDPYGRFLELAGRIRPAVVQVRYNLLSPTFDDPRRDIFAWAAARGVGVVINKPLSQGLLLDKYDPRSAPLFPPGDHRNGKRWFSPHALAVLSRRLTVVRERFGSRRGDLVRVALQYCLARSLGACVVVGFKSPDQVAMNVAAAGRPLRRDDIAFLRKAMAGIGDEIGAFFPS